MFYIEPGQSYRLATAVIRLHYMQDNDTSVGFVEQTQACSDQRSLTIPATFRAFINGGEHATFDGIEVLDLEAGMALVKILATNI
jgi:hypothetical protein